MKFSIESVNISEKKGVQKRPVGKIELKEGYGIVGDAHAGKWHRQVSFLSIESIDHMREKADGFEIRNGDFGENIITRGIDWKKVKVGARIRINGAELEVTQIGKECHSGCAIYDAVGECIMPKQGIFARVLKGGVVSDKDIGYYSL